MLPIEKQLRAGVGVRFGKKFFLIRQKNIAWPLPKPKAFSILDYENPKVDDYELSIFNISS
jgi:hypothetical protein